MTKWIVAPLAMLAFVVVGALLSDEADGITLSGYFTDDNGNTFENDIDAIAQQGITKGCNPPANTHFCPNDDVTRGEMAAFLRRALDLPAASDDFFDDDDGSTFEADINAIAAAGITKGCNPPANNRFCPNDDVSRGEMAAFIRRARGISFVTLTIPVGSHGAMACSKDGQRCSLTVDVSAGRPYRIQEGIFQATPASSQEQNAFNDSDTSFALSLNGANVSVNELSQQSGGGVVQRRWRRDMTFSPGTHTLIGRWTWDGELMQTSTITVRASG